MNTHPASSSSAGALLQTALQLQERTRQQAAAVQQLVIQPQLPGNDLKYAGSNGVQGSSVDLWA